MCVNKLCVLLALDDSRATEHNFFKYIFTSICEKYGIDTRFEIVYLKQLNPELSKGDFGSHEYLSAVKTEVSQFIKYLPAECVAVFFDSGIKHISLQVADIVDQYVQTVGNANLLVNNSGFKTAMNTDIYGISAALVHSNFDATRVEKALVLGSGQYASSCINALVGAGVKQICVLARYHGGKNNAYVLGCKAGIDIQPVPYNAPAIATDFICSSDLVVSTLPTQENNKWADILKDKHLKSNLYYMESDLSGYPSQLFLKAFNVNAKCISPFESLFYQCIMSVKTIFAINISEDNQELKKEIFANIQRNHN